VTEDLLDINVPRVTRTVQQHVTFHLSEFKLEEVAQFLRDHGYQVDGAYSRSLVEAAATSRRRRDREDNDSDEPQGLLITDEELERVGMLWLIGQREAARQMVLDIVSEHIGRPL
jgi:hypothetical protein